MATHRFVWLDGLRGVAALLVVLRHTEHFWTFELFRSYLAVDVFFVISGFVIGYAYDAGLAQRCRSPLQFMRVRLLRLYPVYLLSLLIAAAVAWYRWLPPGDEVFSHQDIAEAFLLGLLFLPALTTGTASLYALNGPYWSLLFELLINALYAWCRPLLSTRVMLSALALATPMLAILSWHNGSLDTGYDWGKSSLLTGLMRAAYGILAGLLLHRFHQPLLARLPAWLSPPVAMLIAAIMLVSPSAGAVDALIDLLCVLLLVPVCVLAASRPGSGAPLQRALLWLGSASYPMYVLHQPLGKLVAQLWPQALQQHPQLLGAGFIVILLAGAALLERHLDTPLRRKVSGVWHGRLARA